MAKRFIDAGTPKAEAEVFAEALKEIDEKHLDNMATKNDLKELKADMRDDLIMMKTDIKDYIKLCTVVISLGMAALAFLMTYLKVSP